MLVWRLKLGTGMLFVIKIKYVYRQRDLAGSCWG